MAVPGIAAGIVIQPDNDFQNKAAQFTAANTEYLSKASTATLQNGTISIGCWVYLDSKPSLGALLGKWDVGTGLEYLIFYNGGGTDRFRLGVSSNGAAQTYVNANNLGAPSLSTWYFVQAWNDGTNINISVNDGTADTTAFATTIYTSGTAPFLLGAYGTVASPVSPHNGRIDCAYMAESNIGATVRTSLYNSGSGKKWSQLTKAEQALFSGYWNLQEASGTRVDCTNNANNLSDNNTVTQAAGRTT